MTRDSETAESSGMDKPTPTCAYLDAPIAHGRHVKIMQKEYAKFHKNPALGAELMELSDRTPEVH